MDILIKNATKKDAESVAWVIFAALDEYSRASEKMLGVCSESDTLYSYDKMRLVYVDGKIAGGLLSYEGKEYSRLREITWERCWDESPEILKAIGQECFAGEYYLDSMALLPEYRKMGLGKKLVLDAVEIAKSKGCQYVTLLADKQKSGLVSYYQSIGFEIFGSMIYFGHDYWRMRIIL